MLHIVIQALGMHRSILTSNLGQYIISGCHKHEGSLIIVAIKQKTFGTNCMMNKSPRKAVGIIYELADNIGEEAKGCYADEHSLFNKKHILGIR